MCCAEELCRLAPDDQITLLSSDTVLKVRELLVVDMTSTVHYVSMSCSGQALACQLQVRPVRLSTRATTFLLGSCSSHSAEDAAALRGPLMPCRA